MSFYNRRSFSARYSGMLIRSTLEYIYIRCLELQSIPYVYEPLMLTTASGKRYKPDFYLPNTDEYVEIKPVKYLAETEKFAGLKITVLTEVYVYNLAKNLGLDRYKLSKEWRVNAEIGPYGSITFKELKCLCGKTFKVTTASNKTRKFCSTSCSAIQEHRKEQSKKGAQAEKDNQQVIYDVIQNEINTFVRQNINEVLLTKENKLTVLSIWKTLYKTTGIKDMRIYSKALFGKDLGRKEILRYMKRLAENVRRTNEN